MLLVYSLQTFFEEKKVSACPFRLLLCLKIGYRVIKMGLINYKLAHAIFVCGYGDILKLDFH